MTETQTILKASDLRIGNWVNTSVEPSLTIDHHKVKEISGDFCYCDGVGSCEWDDITPIPLTPKILEKVGLKNMENFLGVYRIKIDEMVIDIPMGKDKVAPYAKYKYVHQIQNLYHSLTGKELEIDL